MTGIWERRSKEHRGQTSMATSLTAFTNLCPDFLPLARARESKPASRVTAQAWSRRSAHTPTPHCSSPAPKFLGPSQASS